MLFQSSDQNPNLSIVHQRSEKPSTMESDDDYESFSLLHSEPSPSPKHRRLKRLKTVVPEQSPVVKSVSGLLELPKVDFARLEALESSEIRGFDDSNEPFSSQSPLLSEGFESSQDKEMSSGFGDGKENGLGSGFGDGKENGLGSGLGDGKENELGSGLGDGKENELGSSFDDLLMSNDRKKMKRVLEFDDGIDVNDAEGKRMGSKIREDEKNEVDEGETNEKKGKKKRIKCSDSDPKAKATSSNKRREEKERRAHLQQLHAESQRILRETRGAAFKPVPLVQKPISSVLEKIRRRKLEVSKKFFQSNSDNLVDESDGCLREFVTDHSRNITIEKRDIDELSEPVKLEKFLNVRDVEPGSEASHLDALECPGVKLSHNDAPSPTGLVEEPISAFRAPIDDTQDLFGDSQTSNNKASRDELPSEQTTSPEEEELAPSWLTMKLKFDSAPDDISDEEEENDKENIDPLVQTHASECCSPKGDPVKAFVDDEAEEEDDSDYDLMRFGEDEDDEENGDSEELADMIATGYEERPVDNEARNELHQKWLEEKDAAGTDDLFRRLNVASKLREASLLDDDEGEEETELSNNVEEDIERPRAVRLDSRKAKQLISQMFADQDEAFLSSDDEETEKQLVRRRVLDKAEEQAKLVSPLEDENSREVFSLIKKLNITPETRKKTKPTSLFDTMLTGGNSNSSSKSSFLSRVSNHSVSTSRKQGSAIRSFVFGREDSNSRGPTSMSEDSSDTILRENQTKKVTTKFGSSQARSSTQTTKIVAEAAGGTTSLWEMLKQSSMQSHVLNQDAVIDLSQSVLAAFKIPKKPMRSQARV